MNSQDINRMHEISIQAVDDIRAALVACGSCNATYQAIAQAYDLGYEAGKNHDKRLKESGRSE